MEETTVALIVNATAPPFNPSRCPLSGSHCATVRQFRRIFAILHTVHFPRYLSRILRDRAVAGVPLSIVALTAFHRSQKMEEGRSSTMMLVVHHIPLHQETIVALQIMFLFLLACGVNRSVTCYGEFN